LIREFEDDLFDFTDNSQELQILSQQDSVDLNKRYTSLR